MYYNKKVSKINKIGIIVSTIIIVLSIIIFIVLMIIIPKIIAFPFLINESEFFNRNQQSILLYNGFNLNYNENDLILLPLNSGIINSTNKTAALEHILSIATTNYENSNRKAKLSYINNEFEGSNITGKVSLRGLTLLNGHTYYYQNVGQAYDVDPSAIEGVFEIKFNQGLREYSNNMTDFYIQDAGNDGNPEAQEEFPFVSCDFDEGEVQQLNLIEIKDHNSIRSSVGEFTNYIFNCETINGKSIKISLKDNIYKVEFSLKLDTKENIDLATELPRDALRAMYNTSDLEITKYEVTMEIWDNGLIKSFQADSDYEGTIKCQPISNPNLVFSSTAIDYYSWYLSDSIIDYVNDNTIELDWVEDIYNEQ